MLNNSCLTPKGYRIPKSEISKKDWRTHKSNLTVKPFVLPDYDFNIVSFPVYRHNANYFYVPKFYALEHFPVSRNNSEERIGNDITIEFKGKLRPIQEDIINKVYKHITEKDSAILSLVTGIGKTVLALYLSSKLSKKTLVLVHKEFLMNQWIERINQFLPDARVGIIRQNKVEVDDKDIVIGMLQSISQRDYPKEIFDNFGFCIYDESHHICTQSFSKALYKVNTKKCLGLSATPERKDGLTKVLNWFLGDIITHDTRSEKFDITIKCVKAEYHRKPEPKLNMRGKVNLPDLITKITLDPTRNEQIIKEIKTMVTDGHKVLVLSERRQHCINLQEFLLEDSIECGLYIGGMKEDDLALSNTKQVILATYNMAAEGYDCADLTGLVMATGRSDIQQSVGRIMRKRNKKKPYIVDFSDSIDGLRNQAQKRKRFYRKNKYCIIDDKTLVIDSREPSKGYPFLD